MCNSKNHSRDCRCGFGGPGHQGRRTGSYELVSPPRDFFLDRHPEFARTRRVAACFVNHNAKCPDCGESVFYYQNERGSRVYFDDLGPPWPKHPCTDSERDSAPVAGIQLGLTFDIRSQQAVAEIMTWQKNRGISIESEFTTKNGNSPWPLATVWQRMKSKKLVFVAARLLKQGRVKRIYFSCKSLPKCCKKGFLIAVGKRKISFIDSATLDPVEVAIKRYRGAAPFFDAMDDADADER